MTYYTVRILTKSSGTSPTIFEEDGLAVYNQILHKMDVRSISEEGETIIPYDAIVAAFISTETEEDEPVVDAVCNETNG